MKREFIRSNPDFFLSRVGPGQVHPNPHICSDGCLSQCLLERIIILETLKWMYILSADVNFICEKYFLFPYRGREYMIGRVVYLPRRKSPQLCFPRMSHCQALHSLNVKMLHFNIFRLGKGFQLSHSNHGTGIKW